MSTLRDHTPVKWAVGYVMRRHSSRSDVSRRAYPTAHLTRTKQGNKTFSTQAVTFFTRPTPVLP